ncbi:MAG: hypothetical protein AAF514_00390 [Verrucomicrobiota bacterium]
MFHRVLFDNWGGWIPIIGFFITFVAFGCFVIRALLMKKEKARALARLPLSDEERPNPTEPNEG